VSRLPGGDATFFGLRLAKRRAKASALPSDF